MSGHIETRRTGSDRSTLEIVLVEGQLRRVLEAGLSAETALKEARRWGRILKVDVIESKPRSPHERPATRGGAWARGHA